MRRDGSLPSSLRHYQTHICATALPSPPRIWAEFQVHAGLDDIDISPDVDRKGIDRCAWRYDWARGATREADRLIIVTVTIVIIFNEPGEPVEEGVFDADTDGPHLPSIADRRQHSVCGLEGEVGSQPGAA